MTAKTGPQRARAIGPYGKRGRRLGFAAAVLAAVALLPTAGHAQVRTLERLVMPGPVIDAHARYETQCASCHARFARESQRQLCLDCHKEIAADFATKKGFHSKSREVGDKECASCHTDHKGRDADVVKLDHKRFDHKLTDFALDGKHTSVECEGCHAAGKQFHAARAECIACHQKDDRHRGNLGAACAECHSTASWKEARFDHATSANYPLTGAHAKASCASCHAEEHYKDTLDTCNGCHAKDDKHHGRNGIECRDCHTTNKWSEVLFDHFARAKFALRGGHAGLKCESCHTGDKLEEKLPTDCYGCHREDDKHEGRNGTQCADCHRVTVWRDVTFDHERDGHFALNGAHRELDCNSCHVQPAATVKLPTDCDGCHAKDDPHQAQLGKQCGSCHGETAWKRNVRFDHDLTEFPLVGKHATVECDGCHATKAFHDAKTACVDCHAGDDAHKRTLGGDCASCHDPSDWQHWVFDHDTRTSFKLDGKHADLKCDACHRQPARGDRMAKLATSCGSCHRNDDVHHGEFGQECERCHTTQSFRALRGPK